MPGFAEQLREQNAALARRFDLTSADQAVFVVALLRHYAALRNLTFQFPAGITTDEDLVAQLLNGDIAPANLFLPAGHEFDSVGFLELFTVHPLPQISQVEQRQWRERRSIGPLAFQFLPNWWLFTEESSPASVVRYRSSFIYRRNASGDVEYVVPGSKEGDFSAAGRITLRRRGLDGSSYDAVIELQPQLLAAALLSYFGEEGLRSGILHRMGLETLAIAKVFYHPATGELEVWCPASYRPGSEVNYITTEFKRIRLPLSVYLGFHDAAKRHPELLLSAGRWGEHEVITHTESERSLAEVDAVRELIAWREALLAPDAPFHAFVSHEVTDAAKGMHQGYAVGLRDDSNPAAQRLRDGLDGIAALRARLAGATIPPVDEVAIRESVPLPSLVALNSEMKARLQAIARSQGIDWSADGSVKLPQQTIFIFLKVIEDLYAKGRIRPETYDAMVTEVFRLAAANAKLRPYLPVFELQVGLFREYRLISKNAAGDIADAARRTQYNELMDICSAGLAGNSARLVALLAGKKIPRHPVTRQSKLADCFEDLRGRLLPVMRDGAAWSLTSVEYHRQAVGFKDEVARRKADATATRKARLSLLKECRTELAALHDAIARDMARGVLAIRRHVAHVTALTEKLKKRNDGAGDDRSLADMLASSRSDRPLSALYHMEDALRAAGDLGYCFAGEDNLFAAFHAVELAADYKAIINKLGRERLLTAADIAEVKGKSRSELTAVFRAVQVERLSLSTQLATEVAKDRPNERELIRLRKQIKKLSAKEALLCYRLVIKLRNRFFELLEAYYQAKGPDALRQFRVRVQAYHHVVATATADAADGAAVSFEEGMRTIVEADKRANLKLLDAAFFSRTSHLMPELVTQLQALRIVTFADLQIHFGDISQLLRLLQRYFVEGNFTPEVHAVVVNIVSVLNGAKDSPVLAAQADAFTLLEQSVAVIGWVNSLFSGASSAARAAVSAAAGAAAVAEPAAEIDYADLLFIPDFAVKVITAKFTDVTLLYRFPESLVQFEQWLREPESSDRKQAYKDKIAAAYWTQKRALVTKAIIHILARESFGYGFAAMRRVALAISASAWGIKAGLYDSEVVGAVTAAFKSTLLAYCTEDDLYPLSGLRRCIELLRHPMVVCGVALPDAALQQEISKHLVGYLKQQFERLAGEGGYFSSRDIAEIVGLLNGLALVLPDDRARVECKQLLQRLQLAFFSQQLAALQRSWLQDAASRQRILDEIVEFSVTLQVGLAGAAEILTLHSLKAFYNHVINQLDLAKCRPADDSAEAVAEAAAEVEKMKCLLAPPLLASIVAELIAEWSERKEISQALVVLNAVGITAATRALYDLVKAEVDTNASLARAFVSVLRSIELDSVANDLVDELKAITPQLLWQRGFSVLNAFRNASDAKAVLDHVKQRIAVVKNYEERRLIHEKLVKCFRVLAVHVDSGAEVNLSAVLNLLELYRQLNLPAFSDEILRELKAAGLEALLELKPEQLILWANAHDGNLQPLLRALRLSAATVDKLTQAVEQLAGHSPTGSVDPASLSEPTVPPVLLVSKARREKLRGQVAAVPAAVVEQANLAKVVERRVVLPGPLVVRMRRQRQPQKAFRGLLTPGAGGSSGFVVIVSPLASALAEQQAQQRLLAQIEALGDEAALVVFLDGLAENADWQTLVTAGVQAYKDSVAEKLAIKINKTAALSLPTLNRLRRCVLALATEQAQADTKQHVDDMLQKFKKCLNKKSRLDYDALRAYSEIILGMGNEEQQLQFAQLCLLSITKDPEYSLALLDLVVDIYDGPVGLYKFIVDNTVSSLSRGRCSSAATASTGSLPDLDAMDATMDAEEAEELGAAAAAAGPVGVDDDDDDNLSVVAVVRGDEEEPDAEPAPAALELDSSVVTQAQFEQCILTAAAMLCHIGLFEAGGAERERSPVVKSSSFFSRTGDRAAARGHLASQLAGLRAMTNPEVQRVVAAVRPFAEEPAAPLVTASA